MILWFHGGNYMNIYIQIFWEHLINILESGLFYYYIRTLLIPKKLAHQGIFHTLAVLIRFLVISACNILTPLPIYGIIICGIYNALFACILFKDAKIKCIFWGSLHGLLCIASEFIVMLFLQAFANIYSSQIYFGESYRFSATALYIIVLAALCFYIPTFASKNVLFKGSQKLFVTIFIVLGIIITHCFMIIMPELERTHVEILDIIILTTIVFLCFFVALLVYMYQLAIKQQENKELQERTKLLEIETAQYNNLLSTTESLRVIKHDIHHHLSTIQTLIENDEVEQIKKYLNEYQCNFDLDYSVATTGNLVIDSIISTKYLIAKRQHTKLDFSIMLPETLPFTDVALSALLGNLFDNALEACKKLPIDQRWITFQMKAQEDMLIIHIENSFDGVLKETISNTYLSRKEEPHHGIGLKRINTLVEEANGFTEIRHNNNVFTVHIMVPLEKTNEF